MQCPVCQFQNREGVRFCEKCGGALIDASYSGVAPTQSGEIRCLNCGAQNPADMSFCTQCGAKLQKVSTSRPNIFCTACGAPNPADYHYCEKCGTSLEAEPDQVPIDSGSGMCPACGAEARPGIAFCEVCGAKLDESAASSHLPQPARPRQRRRMLAFTAALLRRPIVHRPLITLFLIFLIFLIIGIAATPEGPVSIITQESAPLVTWEGLQAGERVPDGSRTLTATAWDNTGVARVEVYVDGVMVSAKNNKQIQGDTSFEYPVPLGNLEPVNHEVFTRVYSVDGNASQSSIIFIDGASLNNSQASSVPRVIEPAAQGPSAPAGLSVSSTGRDEVRVTWQPASQAGKYRVYGRFPGASSMILIRELPSGSTGFSLPVDRPGGWEVYVAAVDSNGQEGSLSHIAFEVKDSSGSVEIPADTLPASSLELRVPGGIDRLYAYVRTGSGDNRYQRLPESGFLTPSSNGRFLAELPALNWPADMPLDVEFEIWGWQDSELTFVGSSQTTIPPESWADGNIIFDGENIDAVIMVENSSSEISTANPPPTAKSGQPLPPPTNVHFASSKAECERVASELGQVRNILRDACRLELTVTGGKGPRGFFLWEWPAPGQSAFRADEDDITGFEVRFVITDDKTQQVVSEKITSVPSPQARGWMRDVTEATQKINCNLRRSWYIRAVGEDRVSEWVYISTIAPAVCAPTEEYPAVNGCGGQSDSMPDVIPDLIFEEACNTHDRCYVREWSHTNKVICDNQFWLDMQEVCLKTGVDVIAPEKCIATAHTYYEFVNLAGRIFYEGPISVKDCYSEPAIDPLVCTFAYTPEGLKLIGQGAKAAWDYSVTATQTGWKYTKKGAVFVAEGTVDGVKWTGDKIATGYKKVCRWSWCK